MKKFQLGDKVLVLRDFPRGSCWERGHVGVVTDIDDGGTVLLDGTHGGWIDATIGGDAELVESASDAGNQSQDGVRRTFQVGGTVKVLIDDYGIKGKTAVIRKVDQDGDIWIDGTEQYPSGICLSGKYGEHAMIDDAAEYTGGSVNYYRVKVEAPTSPDVAPYEAECNDIIEALGMNYAEGNAFKAIWRSCAARQGKAKRGYDGLYDAEKVVFFGQRMVAQAKGEK